MNKTAESKRVTSSIDNIDVLIQEKENELVNAKLQHVLGKLKKTHILKQIKREIAVLLTKQRQNNEVDA